MIKNISFTALLLIHFLLAHSQADHESKINYEKRKVWIEQNEKLLKRFSPDSALSFSKVDTINLGDNIRLSVRIINNALINMGTKGWIYVITNSSHSNEEIGDVSLAIDDKKRIYLNDGHVCGGIINFVTDNIKSVKSTNDFFNFFESDTDSLPWEKLVTKSR